MDIKLVPVLALICTALVLHGCQNTETVGSGTSVEAGETMAGQMEHGGIDREYYIHFPTGYQEDGQYPLLLAMHGGFGKAERIESYTGLSDKADEEEFIVVYPQGFWRSWNAGLCCGPAKNQNVDDIGFLSSLIDELISSYPIDGDRVFATGLSNGGFMAYHLLCERPEKLAAIAPVAASMVVESCEPEEPRSIIQFHSYRDENVPYQGGSGTGPSDVYKPPIDSVLNVWADINECSTRNDEVENTSDYDLLEWRDCDRDTKIQLYITRDGGHSWPGGSLNFPDPASSAIDANDLMWDFFTDITKAQ